jgi:hypothetical protein
MTFEETLNNCMYAEPEEVITQMSYDWGVPRVSREVQTIERIIQQELGVI